jgi:hypothetical protein
VTFPAWFQLRHIIDLSALPKEMIWPEAKRIRGLDVEWPPTTITFHDYRKPWP